MLTKSLKFGAKFKNGQQKLFAANVINLCFTFKPRFELSNYLKAFSALLKHHQPKQENT